MDIPSSSVSENHLNDIRHFLASGGNPNHRDQFQDTFLHLSSKLTNGIQVVIELVTAGAYVNSLNFLGRTPLHNAVIERNCEVVTALIQFGALVDIDDCSGNNALHYAINVCASMDQDWKRVNPYCPHRPPDMKIIEVLLDHKGIDVNSGNSQGYTPLLLAVKDKNLDVVKALLRKSALVNIGNHRRETPLHAALSYPNPNLDIAGELLRRGASFICKDKNGHTPLDLVFKWEGDVDSKAFAEEVLKLVTFYDENGEFHISALGLNAKLLYYYMKCHDEILKMQSEFFGEKSLFDLVLQRVKDSTSAPLESKLVNDIFIVLTSRDYSIYFDFILKCISIPAL